MPAASVSIIVPCYNVEETVDVTLTSLLAQPLGEYEILLINDCGSDGTLDILRDYARREQRIKLIENPENTGLGEARNVGMRAATGEYTAFVDSDDWLHPRYLPTLRREMQESGADFVRCDHVTVTHLRRNVVLSPETRRGVDLEPRSSILPLRDSSMVDYRYAWAGLYRTKFLQERDITFQRLHTAEDILFTWRTFMEGKLYRCVSEFGYYYRRETSNTLTTIGDHRQLDFLKAVESTLTYLRDADPSADILAKAHRQALSLLVSHYERRSRLSVEAFDMFKERAPRLMASFDHAALEHALERFGVHRCTVLEELLGCELPWRDVPQA